MAVEQRGLSIGWRVAGADLRALQFTFVKVNGSGQIIGNTTSGGKVLGVLQNKPNTGEPADVMINGGSKVIAGAAITAGADIMSDAAGKAITAATTGSTIAGTAMDSVAASGEVCSVVLGSPVKGVV